MGRYKSLIYPVVFLGAFTQGLGKSGIANAQVTSDGSLAIPTAVLTFGNQSTINGGTPVNNHLFHSFSQFSITPGGQATFNSAPTIDVIFARVTGGSPSAIRGGIVVPGATDLFLLNPAGIEFSNGSTLSMGGSLIVTTAETITFAEGDSFSAATGALNNPLLNVNVPNGLQWGAQANGLSFSEIAGNYGGGQALQLLGGPVMLNDFQISFDNKDVSLGAVGPNSQVNLVSSNGTAQLESLVADYSAVSTFEDITLGDGTSIDTEGIAPGNFRVQGRQIELREGSRISSETQGAGTSGNITINASNSLTLQGLNNGGEVAQITVGTSGASTGSGGRLLINAPTVSLTEGAQLRADASAGGNGGSIEVNATNLLEVRGEAQNNPGSVSGIFVTTDTSASGDAGRLDVNAGTLRLLDGAVIDGRTVNGGAGPIINLNGTNLIEVRGSNTTNSQVSQINGYGLAGSSGAGAIVGITTNQLTLQEGGIIDLRPQGSGNGGNVTINAQDIVIQGTGPTAESGIFSRVTAGQGGNGGDVEITTASLRLVDGGAITTGADQAVNGGELSIQATNNLQIDGSGQAGNGQTSISRILNQVTQGNSGAVTINAGDVNLSGGGLIGSYLQGSGTSGPLTVNGDRITIAGDNQSFSRIAALDLSGTGGNLGDLTIAANSSLALVNGGRISTQAGGTTTPGNLAIAAADLQISGAGQVNSQITTLATNGAQGGDLSINAPQLSLDDQGRIFSQGVNGGRGGDIGITSNALNLLNTTGNANGFSEILTQGSGVGQGGNITIATDGLQLTNASRIRLLGDNGSNGSNLTVTANTLALDGGVIQSQLNGATGGNLDLTIADSIAIANGAEIKTELTNSANGGNITLTTQGNITASGNSDIYTSVTGAQGGDITVAASELVDLEVRNALTPNNDLVTGGTLALTLTPVVIPIDPPVEPPVEPPVDPPIEPPVEPPVDPPVTPPVEPPVNPPVLPPVEPPTEPPITPDNPPPVVPPGNPTAINNLALLETADVLARALLDTGLHRPPSPEEAHKSREALLSALRKASTIEGEKIVPSCTPSSPKNRFVSTGRGGLPRSPSHVSAALPLWQEPATTKSKGQVQPEAPRAEWSANQSSATALTEAQAWTVGDNGQVKLLAGAAFSVQAPGCRQS